jgi:mannose-6-phosphate isomerase class I
MTTISTEAHALLRDDSDAVERLASRLIKPVNNNLIERPWGGRMLLDYKGLRGSSRPTAAPGMGFGEAFEIAAYDRDPEARRFPSRLLLGDGSSLTLPELLERHAAAILGDDFAARYGACFPLLPKTLDIAEMLSVQGHPPGNTEVYIIIAADPGATIRLGFSEDIDRDEFARALRTGREQQAELAALGDGLTDSSEFQSLLKAWFADREATSAELRTRPIGAAFAEGAWPVARRLLDALKQVYWRVLDVMNAVPVAPGQVIYNATPRRLLGAHESASAEVHALGNPEGKEILALEVRRPGPTFRAWDNVRFPLREIDIEAALDALNLKATSVDEFIVEPAAVAGRPGVFVSVDADGFRVEHLRPKADLAISVPHEAAHCLHAIRGQASFRTPDGIEIGQLRCGESALVPIGTGAYVVSSTDADNEIVKVGLTSS